MRVAFEHVELDSEARTLECEGRRVAVEPKVFDLLVYLIEHRERVASSQELLDALWPGISVGPAALSGAVHKARQAVGDDGERQAVLRTVHGRGFQFVAELSDVVAPEETSPPTPSGSGARRLVAILFSDIVGYTPSLESDESRAIALRDRHRALLRPVVEQFHGELIETPGDEALAIFASSLGAVECALALQAALRDADDLKLRIGIHLGDVLFRNGEVVGEGVCVAARIRPLAEPGGICASWEVYEQVKNHPYLHGRSLGSRTLKGVEQPIEVFALSSGRDERPARPRRRPWLGLAAGAVLLLVAASFWLLTRPVPQPPSGHTLAVLPFVNMSPDPDQAYFADGVAEELLNTVAGFEGLRVVGRTSSFSFRDSDADLKTIGEKLGADVILEGSVRTEGDRARISAQLVDARDGVHRWSETYDRELSDIFAIQTEIATAIATALRVELSPEQRERLATRPTENLAAYQAYLLGRRRLEKRTTPSLEEAIGYFEQALALDPEFALAYLGLTQTYLAQFEDTGLPPGELMARAQVAAQRALEIDDRLAEAYAALGTIKWFTNDFDGAEAAYRHALELSPNSAAVLYDFGLFLAGEPARYEEALALHQRAFELDPLALGVVSYIGIDLDRLGRFEESRVWFEKELEIDPDSPGGYVGLGFHHWRVSGRLDEAVVWKTKALALDPENISWLTDLGKLLLDIGDVDQAQYWIARAAKLAPAKFRTNLALEYLHLYRSREAAAYEAGRRAFAVWPLYLSTLPLLRDHAVRAGQYAEARTLYEEYFPELLYDADPEIDARNYRAAIDLALVLSRTGEQSRADLLLSRSLEQIQDMPRLGGRGYWIADVQIHALQGEKQKALAALRQAIDEGWRVEWWYQLQYKPDLAPLHDEPEFQAMVEEIRADMATQLAHLREMERSGELVFPAQPGLPTAHAADASPADPR